MGVVDAELPDLSLIETEWINTGFHYHYTPRTEK